MRVTVYLSRPCWLRAGFNLADWQELPVWPLSSFLALEWQVTHHQREGPCGVGHWDNRFNLAISHDSDVYTHTYTHYGYTTGRFEVEWNLSCYSDCSFDLEALGRGKTYKCLSNAIKSETCLTVLFPWFATVEINPILSLSWIQMYLTRKVYIYCNRPVLCSVPYISILFHHSNIGLIKSVHFSYEPGRVQPEFI